MREDDYVDWTPLHLAARYNENPAVIEALIAAGAKVREDDSSDQTPLHFAARYNENPAVADALIAAGAKVEEGDDDNYTPLYYATNENPNPAVAEALRAAGADRQVVASRWRYLDIAGDLAEAVAAGLGGATTPGTIGNPRNTGGTVEPPLSADPNAAQEQLLSAMRESVYEGMCGNFTAVDLGRALEAYLASMESAAR